MKALLIFLFSLSAISSIFAQDNPEKSGKWKIMINVNQSYAVEEVRDDKLSNPGVSFQFNKQSKTRLGFQTKIAYTKWNAYEIADSAVLLFGVNYKLSELGKFRLNSFLNSGIIGYAGGDTYTGVHFNAEAGLHILPQHSNGFNAGINFTYFPQFFNSVNVFAGYVF